MIKLNIIFLSLLLTGCIPGFGVGDAIKGAGIGAGAALTGSALNNKAKADLVEAENHTLDLKLDDKQLGLAVQVISTFSSDTIKVELLKEVLHLKETLDLDENKTERSRYMWASMFWLILGVLIGFILARLTSKVKVKASIQ